MKRLFGNENTRHSELYGAGEWDQISASNRAAAKVAAAVEGVRPAAQPPPFPYPRKVSIDFGTAQTSELWLPVGGYAVSFWDSTNLTDSVTVRFGRSQGDDTGDALPFRPGHALGLGDFTWLGLSWSQVVGAKGTLVILPRAVLLDENR